MAAVVLNERLGSLAASLAGWQSARVAQDDVVWKPPGSGPVAYHQDSAYISRQFVPVSVILPPSLDCLYFIIPTVTRCDTVRDVETFLSKPHTIIIEWHIAGRNVTLKQALYTTASSFYHITSRVTLTKQRWYDVESGL